MGPNVFILDVNHETSSTEIPMMFQGIQKRKTTILARKSRISSRKKLTKLRKPLRKLMKTVFVRVCESTSSRLARINSWSTNRKTSTKSRLSTLSRLPGISRLIRSPLSSLRRFSDCSGDSCAVTGLSRLRQ